MALGLGGEEIKEAPNVFTLLRNCNYTGLQRRYKKIERFLNRRGQRKKVKKEV